MTKKARRATLLSSAALIAALTVTIIIATRTEAYAQFMESYHKLSKPEQKWALHHPWAAFRTHKLADSTRAEATRRLSDPELDGDLNGGMVDAFKHTLWMALTAQKIGARKAILLGEAHEEGNRLEYVADPTRKSTQQDSIASRMDMLNNVVGARIGEQNPKADFSKLVAIVRRNVIEGKCWKIKKKDKNTYLDADGKVINIHDYDNSWAVPKVLVESDK